MEKKSEDTFFLDAGFGAGGATYLRLLDHLGWLPQNWIFQFRGIPTKLRVNFCFLNVKSRNNNQNEVQSLLSALHMRSDCFYSLRISCASSFFLWNIYQLVQHIQLAFNALQFKDSKFIILTDIIALKDS